MKVIIGAVAFVCSLLFSTVALVAPGVAVVLAIPFGIALAALLLTPPQGGPPRA